MPSFDIVKEIKAGQSFKIEQVKSGFDLQTDHITEHFKGDIAIEGKDWNIGPIREKRNGKNNIEKKYSLNRSIWRYVECGCDY